MSSAQTTLLKLGSNRQQVAGALGRGAAALVVDLRGDDVPVAE